MTPLAQFRQQFNSAFSQLHDATNRLAQSAVQVASRALEAVRRLVRPAPQPLPEPAPPLRDREAWVIFDNELRDMGLPDLILPRNEGIQAPVEPLNPVEARLPGHVDPANELR